MSHPTREWISFKLLRGVGLELTRDYSMLAACHTATSYFNLWLKAEGYSVTKINYLPTGGNALAIVVTLAWGMIADSTGQFYWLIMSLQFVMI